jgi:hypothetical protein
MKLKAGNKQKNQQNSKLILCKDQWIDKPLGRITEKKKSTQITNIRNKRSNITMGPS